MSFFLMSGKKADVELELKLLLDNKIELKIPKGFEIMSEELVKAKYPMNNRPTLVFTNNTGSVNVALNWTQSRANQVMLPAYKDSFIQMFKNVHPSAEWKSTGIKEINGRKVGYLCLITPAVDTKIYNLMFFTDLDGR